MIGTNFKYKGSQIPTEKTEAKAAGWLVEKLEWTGVTVENSQITRQDTHGTFSNPTFARGRLITLEGQFWSSSRESRGQIRNTIENVFQLEPFPRQNSGFYKLEFTDDDGSEWFLNAKVYQKPEFVDGETGYQKKFFCELFSQDPRIYSNGTILTSTTKGRPYSGIKLSTTLPMQLNKSIFGMVFSNSGNFSAPIKFTISGACITPKILNVKTGDYWEMDLSMNEGDTLIIDSTNYTAELNSSNVLAQRASGSSWLFADIGENEFVLTDQTAVFNRVQTENNTTLTAEFYSIKI